jgi:hypothetical protein
MGKALVPLLMFSAIVFASAAQAATSVSCMYMLMRVYHAELEACKVTLPKVQEDRYLRLRATLEKFIRANAKVDPEKMISGIETDNIKRALAGLKSCQSDDFKFARQAIERITTADNEAAVNSTVSIPRDPNSGDCGT